MRRVLVQPGTEPQITGLHGKILGQMVTLVLPTPSGIYIDVLPSSTEGKLPLGTSTVWGIVVYSSESGYRCFLHNLGEGKGSRQISCHPSLKSALRRARREVAKHNSGRAARGWTLRARQLLQPLESIYPSDTQYMMDDALRTAVYEDMDREMEPGFDDIEPVYDEEYNLV